MERRATGMGGRGIGVSSRARWLRKIGAIRAFRFAGLFDRPDLGNHLAPLVQKPHRPIQPYYLLSARKGGTGSRETVCKK